MEIVFGHRVVADRPLQSGSDIPAGNIRIGPASCKHGRAVARSAAHISNRAGRSQVNVLDKIGAGPRSLISKLEILLRIP